MPKPPFAAHTPPEDDPDRWHPLLEHLCDTAANAVLFAEPFGAGSVARALALSHDLAKANPRFQEYLRACHEGRPAPRAPHAAPGAKAVYDRLKGFTLALVGHHAGLPDPADFKRLMAEADPAAVQAATDLAQSFPELQTDPASPPAWASDPVKAEFLIRMLFSVLVDADFLDTERHFARSKAEYRGGSQDISWYRDTLRREMTRLTDAAARNPSKVNDSRKEILYACRAKADGPPGAYRLTVPTGGGKTLAGLTFALDHAAYHQLRRVIVAIPYTSIIDQTAQVYEGVFGEGNVLEHHSAYEADDGDSQSEREYRRRLAAENWDSPLVVTTTVQLFESLFANKPSRCRKLHNIAGSVLILDEVQTLPVHLLPPILDVLTELVLHYGCTIVFCTATQPDFSGLGDTVLTRAIEIVDRPDRYFEALKRVAYEHIEEPVTAEDLAARIDAETQVLCVLNSRPDAVRVVQACRPGEDLFHLSTRMCPDHRKTVLAEVRHRLSDGLPVRLVSTQVVEAGVDLDFPLVMRDVGPLERIVQVAGRCNREGRMDGLGRCIVFHLADAKAPAGPYQTGIGLTGTVLGEQPERLDQPDVVAGYFRDLYRYAGAEQGKGRRIQEWRKCLHYETVAREFRLIDEDTVPVVVMRYKTEQVNRILASAPYVSPRHLRRRLAPFSVSLPRYQFREMQKDGTVYEHDSGVWLYEGAYNNVWGIGSGMEWDPSDLITPERRSDE